MSESRDKLEPGRERILAAAAAVIAKEGFHGMSMRSLAKKTGRSLGGFYNYFGSKEQVLLALQTRAFGRLNSSAAQLIDSTDDPIAQLYLFVANHIGYFVKNSDVMRVLVTEASTLPSKDRKKVRDLKERYFNLARETLERIAANRGESIEPLELERATYNFFGMLNWIYAWYEPKTHGTPLDVAASVHRMTVRGLTACSVPELLYQDLGARLDSGELPSLLQRPSDGAMQ